MPLFILIAGYFSKKFHDKGYVKKLAGKLIIPYVIFQLLYTLYYKAFDDPVDFTLVTPRWAMWFLLSLFFWNLMLFVFTKFKHGMWWAFLFSLAAGYIPFLSAELSLSRTFFFFPFFLAGYYLKKEHFLALKKTPYQWTAGIGLAFVFIFLWLLSPIEIKTWLMGKRNYFELADSQLIYAWSYRFSLYVAIALVSLCVLTLIPKRETFFTSYGQHSLYIFLLHLVLVKLVVATPIRDFISDNSLYWLLIVFTVAICFITKHRITRKIVDPLVNTTRYFTYQSRNSHG